MAAAMTPDRESRAGPGQGPGRLTLDGASLPGACSNAEVWAPPPSDSVGLHWGPRICISHGFPGKADAAAGPGANFGNTEGLSHSTCPGEG